MSAERAMRRRDLLLVGGALAAASAIMGGTIVMVVRGPPPPLDTHDYAAVLQFYRDNPRLLTFNPRDWNDRSDAHWVKLAKAHISLGHLPEAVRCLERSAENRRLSLEPGRGPPEIQRFLGAGHVPMRELWAAVQFLMGNVGRAIAFHRDILEGISSGRITWTDMWGGAGTALMLVYYADRGGDVENLEYAIEFIRKLRRSRPHYSIWLHAIGELSEQDMLMDRWKVSDWDSTRRMASKTVSERWMLQSASFAAAVARGRAGDSAGRSEMLRYCAMIEPVYESAWFLARRECGMSFRWREN